MNEAFVIDRDFLFKENIFEISSISIEHNYDINGSFCEGEFIVSGDYRLHEISINKEDFSFKIPFSHEIKSNINLDSVSLEITDFNYDFGNDDELHVHIEYVVSGEQSMIEFADEKSLDEFLANANVEVIDLTEDRVEEPKEEAKEEQKKEIKEEIRVKEEPMKEEPIKEEKMEDRDKINETTILNSINSEDSFIKYHVHTVSVNDTIETILSRYSISLIDLKKYNSFETLELNMKLIIPENEEN